MATSTGKKLYTIDSNNPKDVITTGLKLKTENLGELRVPFDLTVDYPSRETYEHDMERDRRVRRKIVIKKLNNTVKTYGIGQNALGYRDLTNMVDKEVYGHVDLYTMEISCWSPDSADRDNLVELIKLWMLELEQELQSGEIVSPFFYAKNLLAIKFLRAYEDVNMEIYRNGPIYIGSLVYEVVIPFFHSTNVELERYKTQLTANVLEFDFL